MSMASLTAFGEQSVAEFTATTGWNFAYNINADMVSTALVSGTVAQSNGMAVLSTGAAINQSATMTTKRVLRYIPGHGGLARFTAIFTPGVAGSTQIIGIGDASDGFCFGFNGATFGTLMRRAGVDVWTPMTAWSERNRTDIDNLFNPARGNIFQIRYQWLGFGAVRFSMEDPDTGEFSLVHMYSPANALTATTILNPALPLFAQVANTTNNTDIVLRTPSGIGGVEGKLVGPAPIHPFSFYRTVKAGKTGITTETNVLTIRNNTTFQSVANRVRARLTALSFLGEGTGTNTVTVQIKINATLGGSPSYTAYNANTSPVSYDTAGTTVASGTVVFSGEFARNDGQVIDLEKFGIELGAGDTATVSVSSGATVAPDLGLTWVDLL
jgi:hypothetical protein